jgi:prolyl-tRNA editing enzyme YbaK/EbsC (Cys-tRNA(Pro) deacylase)
MENKKLSSIQKVQKAIKNKGYDFHILELPDSTRTAREAAEVIGCAVSEIAKSLIFKGGNTGRPVLIIASGTNRVDLKKVGELLGEPLNKADADFIRTETGFAIGGIPPVGHKKQLHTIIDEDLLNYETVWAAAGTPFSVFSLEPKNIEGLTGGLLANIKE